MLRADWTHYGYHVIAGVLRRGTRFSLTARQDNPFDGIAEDARTVTFNAQGTAGRPRRRSVARRLGPTRLRPELSIPVVDESTVVVLSCEDRAGPGGATYHAVG